MSSHSRYKEDVETRMAFKVIDPLGEGSNWTWGMDEGMAWTKKV